MHVDLQLGSKVQAKRHCARIFYVKLTSMMSIETISFSKIGRRSGPRV